MQNKNIYFFIGTTAELIKLAPIIRELKKRRLGFKIITSGQNNVNFRELESISGQQEAYYAFKTKPIKLSLSIHLKFLIWMVKAFVNYLLFFGHEFPKPNKKNSLFIVHGDTISSLLGALTAKKYGIKLVHVESGLRSFNFFEPFPEELNRFIISRLTNIHFCPNAWSVNNLKKVKGIKINTLNNTLIETLQNTLKVRKRPETNKIISKRKFFVLVLHRQEHIFFKKNLTKKLIKIFSEYTNKDLACILVLHKLTKDFLQNEHLLDKIRADKNFILVPRLPYTEFVQIMKMSEFIATDGGSNQEEAYYMGKPCLILRDVTERIEGLGENALLSHGDENTIRNFLKNYKKYKRKPVQFTIPPSKIIADYLTTH